MPSHPHLPGGYIRGVPPPLAPLTANPLHLTPSTNPPPTTKMDKPTSFQHSFTTAMDDQWDSLIEYAYDKDAVGTTYFVPTSGFEEPVFDDWRVSTQLLGCDDADLGLSYGYGNVCL